MVLEDVFLFVPLKVVDVGEKLFLKDGKEFPRASPFEGKLLLSNCEKRKKSDIKILTVLSITFCC